MRGILILFLFFFYEAKTQEIYEKQIQTLVNDIALIFKGDKVKIVFSKLTYDDNETKFTRLVYNDLSSELVGINNEKIKILVVSETTLKNVTGFAKAQTETEKALLIGNQKIAEYICFGKINDNESGYKIQIRVYETKEGNLIFASKVTIDKTKYFEGLNAQVIGNDSKDLVTTQETIKKQPVPEKKEKKKGDGKFWKAMGEIAANSIQEAVNTSLEKKTGKPVSNQSSSNSNNHFDSTDNSVLNTSDCKSYINFINNTDQTIEIHIFKENPNDYYNTPKELFLFTIAPRKSKKQKVERDLLYYYKGGTPGRIGGYRDWSGTFEVENCDTVDEDIE
jgi:hypothetical protein